MKGRNKKDVREFLAPLEIDFFPQSEKRKEKKKKNPFIRYILWKAHPDMVFVIPILLPPKMLWVPRLSYFSIDLMEKSHQTFQQWDWPITRVTEHTQGRIEHKNADGRRLRGGGHTVYYCRRRAWEKKKSDDFLYDNNTSVTWTIFEGGSASHSSVDLVWTRNWQAGNDDDIQLNQCESFFFFFAVASLAGRTNLSKQFPECFSNDSAIYIYIELGMCVFI